jgi:hypothetical protein
MPAEVVVRGARAAVAPEGGRFARAVVRRSPLIVVEDGVLDAEQQAHVRRLGAAAEAAGGAGTKHDDTGFSVELDVWADPVLAALAAHIDELVGLDSRDQPTARFRRYRAGESHPPHGDHYAAGDGHELLVTAMAGVGEPGAGGATCFPIATPPLRLPAIAGRLALWVNHLRNGDRDRLTLHDGEPVEAGEKVTVTRFLYGPADLAPGIWERLGA